MFIRILSIVAVLLCCATPGLAQTSQSSFTRADSLRGMLTPLRTCYDVTYYHLSVKVDTATRSIEGFTTIKFNVVSDFDVMQVDLFEIMKIGRIVFEGNTELQYEREHAAVFVRFPRSLKRKGVHEITIHYSGTPQEARRPPWGGGFTWARDGEGNPWVAVTCQGLGASSWWPNKDHQSDEPDSMMISVTVPSNLMNVSNGRLRKTEDLPDGSTRYDWFVSYPINNYNVTLNIARYARFSDTYVSGKDTLTLDYYVLPENVAKARRQFEQVKPMMKCFEHYFGPYPFIRDGYKLVESPHLGMEHQSAVAYGNHYLQGYRGRSSSEVGLMFDFIIIHETAHEWWGNSVTSNDIADMWIHESFGAYAEALHVECLFGYDKAMQYVNGKKWNVQNDRPIIGTYGVHQRGSGDMYDKGQLVLNTLRHAINNDSLWWNIVKSIAQKFKYTSINAEDIFSLVNEKTKSDYSYFFEQYLKQTKPPRLEVGLTKKGAALELRHRWVADVEDFRMPVKVASGAGEYVFIYPTTSWQTARFDKLNPQEFRVAEDQFYLDVKLTIQYLDPSGGH
ncbi:MAG: M1 family metallopeptidase [Bacteroidetes bacterium]|nr:M1 family metallopeptidase [Bacteroidota bacterium]MCW5897407.1 M1 family metallopeptidase [Bacteroidota bacterium]